MKKVSLLALTALVLSCGIQKQATAAAEKYSIESECPKAGECFIEVSKDAGLVSSVTSVGRTTYSTGAKEGRTVIKYMYNKKDDPTIQDDSYREEIMVEADGDLTKLNAGSDVKIVYGVFCFCKGSAGYHEVNGGTAIYKDGKITVTIPKVTEFQKTFTFTVNTK